MSVTVPRLAVLTLLLGACGVLALQIRDNLSSLPTPTAMLDAEPDLPAGVPASGAPPDIEPIPFEHFAIVLDRPLFEPDRRTRDQDIEAVDEETAPRPLKATLSGVIHSGASSVALLRARAGGPSRAVPLGGTFRGWTLSRIAPDSVDLTQGGQTVTLEIDYQRRGVASPATSRP